MPQKEKGGASSETPPFDPMEITSTSLFKITALLF
jgi:hypothetical protein